MGSKDKQRKPGGATGKREHVEELLDEGLSETFPASDPVAVSFEDDPDISAGVSSGPAGASQHGPDASENKTRKSRSMEPRLDHWKSSPQGLAAFRHLQTYVEGCGLEHSLLELVKTRASQINGCAYCLDMHTKDARAAGETEQRLYTLSAWRETPFFTARERAALAWTEAVTRISDGPIEESLYEEVKRQFSEREIVDLTLAVVSINGWNRLAIPFQTPPGSYKPHAVTEHNGSTGA